MNRRTVILLLVCLVQLGLVGAATAAQLSARLTGEEYLLRVEPVDPIDPFRGAYVELTYPDLGGPDWRQDSRWIKEGTVFLRLTQAGPYWEARTLVRTEPDSGPYLRCESEGWRLRCGIESLFLPQDEAAAMEQAVSAGSMYARIKVDSRGHAAVVGLVPR